MTRRATPRGAERPGFPGRGLHADVVVCGASFAGLTVARALAHTAASVLVLDRYEVGERQTSACAVPTPWLDHLGLGPASRRQELACMSFTTPHGAHRYRLPWSWTAFDYRTLCQELLHQCDGRVRFEAAKVEGRTGRTVHTDRGDVHAGLLVDALGWRRILGSGPNVQPPEATISRGLEVHPHVHPEAQTPDLDIWIERDLVRFGYGWRVPAGAEARIGIGSYEPRHHVKDGTKALAQRLEQPPVNYQGNWFPHRLRPAVEDDVFFVGDSAGHCIPLSGEGIRPAFFFGCALGAQLRAVLAGERSEAEARRDYGALSAAQRPFYEFAYGCQWLMPRLPPRALDLVLDVLSRPALARPAFAWYLRRQPPSRIRQSRWTPQSSASTSTASSPA